MGKNNLYLNLPNTLTAMRILIIPIFIVVYTFPSPPSAERSLLAAFLFIIASITDWLDGYFARKRGQITKLGKLFDPIADKLLISAVLILLVNLQKVSAWIVIVIIGRELAVTGLRAVASSEGIIIPAEEAGKYKMITQIAALFLLIINYNSGYIDFHLLGTYILWIAMILGLISGGQYFIKFWSRLNPDNIGGR